MKKITLVLFTVIVSFQFAFAQLTAFIEAPPYDNGTSSNRAPNGTSAHAYMRACALVLQTELTNIPANTVITSFGFTLNTGTNTTPVTGNFTLYVENTADIAYSKGTNFPTAIGTMTTVYASVLTVPTTAGSSSITITLSSPFTYTGGGLYVAYDWFSTGPFDLTAAVYRCNYLGLGIGCASAASAGSPAPTTLTNSNFRPCFLWGIANTYTNDIQVSGVAAPGRVNASFNTPHNIIAIIKNASNITKTNINVNLNVTGANLFSNTQTITTLAAGANATVTFPAFNPQLLGANTVSVSVPSDQNLVNNSGTYSQSVTCNEWALNPATGTYTFNAVGFGTGSGILATPYFNPVSSILTGLRGAVSNNATNTGNSVYGVLLSSTGATIAVTNVVVISALSTFITFTFTSPQSLAANTTYYLGFAQMLPFNAVAYYPAGTIAAPYLPPNLYFSTGLAGGVLTPVIPNYGYFGIEAIFINNSGITAVSSPTSICTGASSTLSATGITNYTWSAGPATSSIVVTPNISSTFSVAGTNTMGCLVSTTVSVLVSPLPVTVISNTSSICLGGSVTFTAGGAASYTWNTGLGTANTNTLSDNPTATNIYTLIGSNNAGCTNTVNLTIVVNSFSTLNVPASTVICLGGTVFLTASAASSYTWNTGANIINNNTITTIPTANVTYTVYGENGLGCIDTKMVNITVNSFTPGITSPTAICLGSSITLTATGVGTYTWSNNTTFQSINVTPSVTTGYSVVTLGANGCKGSSTTTIMVNQNPTITAAATRTVICKGETSKLTVQGAATYSWSTSTTGTAVVFTGTSNVTTIFNVMGTDTNGCSNTATVSVKVNGCVGLLENQDSSPLVHIFPNPNAGVITVRMDQIPENAVIEIYNVVGHLIKQQSLISEITVLDLQEESNGIYFVYVLEKNKSPQVSKIIKR